MSYPEPKDPRTDKAPNHQAAAQRPGSNISNAEVKPANEATVDLYFSACDDIAVRILKGGWNPELFGQKELHLTTIEQYAEVLAKKNRWGSIIKVVGIPQHLLEPSSQYKGELTTREIIDKKSDLIPFTLVLKTALPKEHFIGRKSIPNMPGITDMDSPDFIVRDDKKYTRFFLKEWHLDQYLQALKATDIEKMFFIEKSGSVLGVPDNTKVYMARYIPNPVRTPENISPIYHRWNPFQAEVID